MSLRNVVVVSSVLLALAFLASCGSNNNVSVVPPPNGSFSNANLNGTYVFSVAGTDQANGNTYAIVGTFTANGAGGNGQGGITGGTLDINDQDTTVFTAGPLANQSVSGSSTYSIGVDGRGKIALGTSTPFQTIVLDVVLQDSSHGLVTEFDGNGSGSGTLDLQSSGVTPQGTYAFSFAGGGIDDEPLATVGNFAISGGTISGLEDFNDGGFAYPESLGGTFAVGPSSTPGTNFTSNFGSETYDVYVIDSSHLKFIEIDGTGAVLSGDAFSQTSTSIPAGTFAFSMAGEISSNPSDVGGYMVTDGNGNITNTSSEDVNEAGNLSSEPLTFTGLYACATGRCTLSNLASGDFIGGNTLVAYPYNIAGSAGLFLLESDNGGLMSGAAYQQSTTTAFGAAEGYGLNLTGLNGSGPSGTVEVDDIAEFSTTTTACGSATGSVVSGIIDENYAPGGEPNYKMALCGNYGQLDSNGRYGISAAAGNNSISTLNGGFNLVAYTVDGTTFPFMEQDQGQISVGVFVVQNAQDSSAKAAAKFHMFMPPMARSRAALKKSFGVRTQK